MTSRLSRSTLAALIGIAFSSVAAAQSGTPSTAPGTQGILIGLQPASAQAHKADAHKAPADALLGTQNIQQPSISRGLEHKGATGLSGQPNPAAEATRAVR